MYSMSKDLNSPQNNFVTEQPTAKMLETAHPIIMRENWNKNMQEQFETLVFWHQFMMEGDQGSGVVG